MKEVQIEKPTIKTDRVTLEVVRNYLETTCREMGVVMMRTSYSPIFNESLDFTCVIFDAKPELVAQAEFIPAHIGAIKYAVEWIIKEVGPENMRPGEVWFNNDPYRGGCHLPECCVVKPMFHNGEIVAYTANVAHHIDIGGTIPTGFGALTSIFQEGFRSPPVRVYIDDKDNEEFFKIYLANVRTPKYSYGDLKAQIGSLYRGERRIRELIDRYGLKVFQQACEDVKNASEYAMRRTIAEIPDGEYEFESYLEDDGVIPNKKWKIKVTTAIRGDEIIFDYTGSDPQCAGQLNMSFPCVASVSYTALMFITDPSIPRNEGCYRPVTIIAPPSSIVNCSYPAACIGGNTDTYPTATDTVIASLSKVIPGRTAAAHGGTCGCIGMGGVNPETEEPFAYLPIEGMGWGARPWHDGDNAICVVNGNTCPNTPVEVLEVRYPIRINAYELHENSGGPGKYRGGFGIRRIFEYLSPVIISAHTNRHVEKPWGLMGGKPGANTALKVKKAGTTEFKNVVELFNTVSPGKFSGVELSAGDQILYESPGGGGWGNPLERDPESVLKDVIEGVVSLESAKKDYGVQIDEKNFKIDYEATEKLRRGLIGKI